jgi:hypothetical protein
MFPELEIAALRRRLAEHRALLRQLLELRWRLVTKAGRGSEEHAERALRINEETVTALWRAVHLTQLRLADLELIFAGQHEEGGGQAGTCDGLASHRLPPRHRPPLRAGQKRVTQRYRDRNNR